jgi:hypothetical protein
VVAEVHAGFEQLAHGIIGHRHEGGSFRYVRLSLRGGLRYRTGPARGMTLAGKGTPRVNYRLGRRAGYGGEAAETQGSEAGL